MQSLAAQPHAVVGAHKGAVANLVIAKCLIIISDAAAAAAAATCASCKKQWRAHSARQ